MTEHKVVCPHCGRDTVLADSAEVYGGRSYGMIWLCRPCNAYVGCHKNSPTHEPLGFPAGPSLRKLRLRVHDAFDPIWKTGLEVDGRRLDPRRRAYRWLAAKMSLPEDQCHTAMFDTEKCVRALEILQGVVWATVRDAVLV